MKQSGSALLFTSKQNKKKKFFSFFFKQPDPSFDYDSFFFERIGFSTQAPVNGKVHVCFELVFALTICNEETLFGIGRRVNFVCLSAHTDEGATPAH